MDNSEIWKEVKSTDGFYAVSNLGRLKRIKNKIGKPTDRIHSLCITGNGYVRVILCFKKRKFSMNVHSLVCEAFIGKRPYGMCVNHKNSIRHDNRIENLEYITQSQNVLHGMNKTGFGRGEKHNRAKLNKKNVQFIRMFPYRRGDDKFLAEKFKVSRSTIQLVRKNKIWTHA